jgi:hypothetical protein
MTAMNTTSACRVRVLPLMADLKITNLAYQPAAGGIPARENRNTVIATPSAGDRRASPA